MSNSNKTKGDAFRDFAKPILEKELKTELEPEKEIYTGIPKHEHTFDLVSTDKSIIIECKRYTWRESGKQPNGKIATLNEAVLYFSFLDYNIQKILCLMESKVPERKETLAEYYVNTYGHLLRDVIVYEIAEDGSLKRRR